LTRFQALMRNWWGIMVATKRLTLYSEGYDQIAVVFPFIVGAPAYFSGAIPLGETLRIAYAEGYPEAAARQVRLALGQGTVGTAVKEQRSILLNDVASDPRYISVVPGVQSTLVVPLRNKGAVIGALNLLSSDRDAFDDTDEAMLRAFAAPIAQAIVNARLFESEREYSETMATLAEVGREMSGILDLDELLTRVAHLVKRVIAYRTFGIALLNDDTGTIELKVAISYGEASASASMKIGEGLLGYAVQHKEVVLAPDVAKDPRYINAVPDAKSELVVPLLVKDRCIGAFDLESPELNAFSKRHVELLTLLASEAAVAIENAQHHVFLDQPLDFIRELRAMLHLLRAGEGSAG
jgi:sigma-B regulation protein RsbU (phosphoserine phosphatase)